MKRAGKMWIRDDDTFMGSFFNRTGDKFEIDHLDVALKYVTDFSVAVDCGAHYGSWTRYLAKKFDAVLAFEPMPTTYQCLERNVDGIENVTIRNSAVGEKNGTVGVGVGKMFTHPGMETINGSGDTPLVTIDSLELPSLGFLKIDVEGYELFALKGAAETLKRFKPVVIFEENIRGELEHGVASGECKQLLENLGAEHVTTCNKDFVFCWRG